MGKLCNCTQNSSGAPTSLQTPGGYQLASQIRTASGASRFLNKAEMRQLAKFAGLSLPPRDIDTLREYYFQRSLMQIRNPTKLYDLPPAPDPRPTSCGLQPRNQTLLGPGQSHRGLQSKKEDPGATNHPSSHNKQLLRSKSMVKDGGSAAEKRGSLENSGGYALGGSQAALATMEQYGWMHGPGGEETHGGGQMAAGSGIQGGMGQGLNSSRMAFGKYETLMDTSKSSFNNQNKRNFSGRLEKPIVECQSPQTTEDHQNQSYSMMMKSSKDYFKRGLSFDQSMAEPGSHPQQSDKKFKIVRYNLLDLKRQRDESPANSFIGERQKMHKNNVKNQQFLQQQHKSIEGQSASDQQRLGGVQQDDMHQGANHEGHNGMRGIRNIYSSSNFLSHEDNQIDSSQNKNGNDEEGQYNDQQLFQFGEINNQGGQEHLRYTTKSQCTKKNTLYSSDNHCIEFRSHNFQIFQSQEDFFVQDIGAVRNRLLQTDNWLSGGQGALPGGDLNNTGGDSNQFPISYAPNSESEKTPIKKSRSSLFSWITQSNAYSGKKEQFNLEFHRQFQDLYKEIFGDFISRIDELREIQSLCQIADNFQRGTTLLDRSANNLDPRRQNEYAQRMNKQYNRRINMADLIKSYNESIAGQSNDPACLSPLQQAPADITSSQVQLSKQPVKIISAFKDNNANSLPDNTLNNLNSEICQPNKLKLIYKSKDQPDQTTATGTIINGDKISNPVGQVVNNSSETGTGPTGTTMTGVEGQKSALIQQRLQIIDIDKEACQESQTRQESSFEINGTPRGVQTQKSIYSLLCEEVDWKDLLDIEEQLGTILQQSQQYFNQALLASTEQKQMLLIETIFNIISDIDQKIGRFEYDLSEFLAQIMDEYLVKAIADLYSQVCEKQPAKEEATARGEEILKEEPNSDVIEDDDLNQYIKEINRPSANNSRRSGRASGASLAQPSSGNYGTGSSIMKIAQGNFNQMNQSKSFIIPKNISLDSLGTSDSATNCEWQIKFISKTISKHFKQIFDKHKRQFPIRSPKIQEAAPGSVSNRDEMIPPPEGQVQPNVEIQNTIWENRSQKNQIASGNTVNLENEAEKTPYRQFKLQKQKLRLLSKIIEVEKEIQLYVPINSDGQKNLQTFQKNLLQIRKSIDSKQIDLDTQYNFIANKINKQLIGVLKDKHQIHLIKIQQMHSLPSGDKQVIMKEILEELNKNISSVDYEFDEMKEQQLHVDMQIEEYFRQIEQYPQALKKLFDIGTQLIQFFDAFYQKWYFFQCEVQQKLYNNIYSKDQLLITAHLDNRHIHELIRNILNRFLELYMEFLAIRSSFDLLEIEINSLYTMFFTHSFEITEQCLQHFDKIGIMDLQGDGALIRESRKQHVPNMSMGLLCLDDLDSPDNICVAQDDILQDSVTVMRTLKKDDEVRICSLEEKVNSLCRNVTEINKLKLAIKNYSDNIAVMQVHQNIHSNKDGQSAVSSIIQHQKRILSPQNLAYSDISTVIATKQDPRKLQQADQDVSASRGDQQTLQIFYMQNYFKKYQQDKNRNQLKNQATLTFQEFLSQKFDQCFLYSQIQHLILSTSEDNPSIIKKLRGGPKSGGPDHTGGAKTAQPHGGHHNPQSTPGHGPAAHFQSSEHHQAAYPFSSMDRRENEERNGMGGEVNSSNRQSDTSGGKQILSEGATTLSVGQHSKESIEFDLFFDVCGIEMNVVQIKKKVKIQRSMLSKHMIGASIYKRELYLNINYFRQKHAQQVQKAQLDSETQDQQAQKAQATQDDGSLRVKAGHTAGGLDFNMEDYYQDHCKKKSIKSASRIDHSKIVRQNQERKQSQAQATPKEQSIDIQVDRLQQMNLIPLGVAMHHLLQSPVMAHLFDSLKKQCLEQVALDLRTIDQEIGSWTTATQQIQSQKIGSYHHGHSHSMGHKSMPSQSGLHLAQTAPSNNMSSQNFHQQPQNLYNSFHQQQFPQPPGTAYSKQQMYQEQKKLMNQTMQHQDASHLLQADYTSSKYASPAHKISGGLSGSKPRGQPQFSSTVSGAPLPLGQPQNIAGHPQYQQKPQYGFNLRKEGKKFKKKEYAVNKMI